MKNALPIATAAVLAGATVTGAAEAPSDQAILAMGAYVPTDDMSVSEAFYETLLARAPVIQLDDFVAFEISGGWFAIVSRARYAPGSVPGTGAVPYLQSGDLDVLQARVEATGMPVPQIIEEPGIRLLKVTDPSGQLVEFFMLTP